LCVLLGQKQRGPTNVALAGTGLGTEKIMRQVGIVVRQKPPGDTQPMSYSYPIWGLVHSFTHTFGKRRARSQCWAFSKSMPSPPCWGLKPKIYSSIYGSLVAPSKSRHLANHDSERAKASLYTAIYPNLPSILPSSRPCHFPDEYPGSYARDDQSSR